MPPNMNPDGATFGPEDGRLPLYDFDEWIVTDGDERHIGVLAAGERKTLVFTGIYSARMGARVFAQPLNYPIADSGYNYDKLLVRAAWVSNEQEISVIVQNDSNAESSYNDDQWSLLLFNTVTPATSFTARLPRK